MKTAQRISMRDKPHETSLREQPPKSLRLRDTDGSSSNDRSLCSCSVSKTIRHTACF